MAKKVVFVTGEKIGVSVSETIHLYRRMVSFKKSGDVSVITQDLSDYPEQAGCKKVVHLGADEGIVDAAMLVAKQADLFVVVGMAPNENQTALLLSNTREECNIAIIYKGNQELPKGMHREHILRMRDMSIGTGLMFLSMYRWMMDLIEE